MERVTSRFWFPAIFAVVILSFVLATSIVHWQLSAIDRHALDIAENAAPSIERLATARAEGRHLQSLMEDYLDNNMHDGTRSIRALEQSHRAFDQAIDDYLLLSPFPSENGLRLEILRAKEAVDHDVIWFQQRTTRSRPPDPLRAERRNAGDSVGDAQCRPRTLNWNVLKGALPCSKLRW